MQEQSGVWSGRGSGSAEFSALERRNRELEELLASEQARGQAAAVAHADLQAQVRQLLLFSLAFRHGVFLAWGRRAAVGGPPN